MLTCPQTPLITLTIVGHATVGYYVSDACISLSLFLFPFFHIRLQCPGGPWSCLSSCHACCNGWTGVRTKYVMIEATNHPFVRQLSLVFNRQGLCLRLHSGAKAIQGSSEGPLTFTLMLFLRCSDALPQEMHSLSIFCSDFFIYQ